MATTLATATRVPGLELELRTDTQYADAYLNGRPFAHLRRRRVIGEASAPVWSIYLNGSSQMWAGAPTARAAVRMVEAEALGALKRRAGVMVSQPAFTAADDAWSAALCEAYGCRLGSITYSRARYNVRSADYPATPAGQRAAAAWRERERCRLAWEHDTQRALEAARAERASA